ncbi:hypothetical protein ACFX13_023999 [Malus domestica]
MDITPPITTTTNTASTKSPEADSETPTRIQQHIKPLSFSNGVLKRHNPTHHLHHHNIPITPVVVTYKECLKNHAATLGGHALDGCGEFMPSPTANSADPTSLKCAACGCHRNFHRRDPEDPVQQNTPAATTHVIEYQPHHRHHPPPPTHPGNRSPNSASPPPISSSYYPSAPHMLLALSTAHENALVGLNNHAAVMPPIVSASPNARKRFRTKFTQDQKDKMHQFAERVGWKMQKRDDEIVQEFCNEVGVEKGVLKVWMHNNKNTFTKRDVLNGGGAGGGLGRPNFLLQQTHLHNGTNGNGNGNGNNNDDDDEDDDDDQDDNKNGVPNPNHHYQGADGGANNGSSSSS